MNHRTMYPEQYAHPLCGKTVRTSTTPPGKNEGVVERVVTSRFGPLAILEGSDGPHDSGDIAYAVSDLEVVE